MSSNERRDKAVHNILYPVFYEQMIQSRRVDSRAYAGALLRYE